MKTTDPLLFGLVDAPEASQPAEPNHPSQTNQTDAVVNTAENLLNRLSETPAPSETDQELEHDSLSAQSLRPDPSPWNGVIPAGSICAANGQPFTDWDSADYKARMLIDQTGDVFFVRASAADRFVVYPEGSSSSVPDAKSSSGSASEPSEDYPYRGIPLKDLRLKHFPKKHPIHKAGLARYRRYMKKDVKLKPAYRSMWPLLLLVVLGGLTYFFPVSSLNLLPPDVIASMVTSVPAEKLAKGTSAFGALLAVFAFGRVVFQRIIRRYTLSTAFAKYEEGILRKESSKIAYLNIMNYELKQSIIARLLNYGTIELASAGTDGSEIIMLDVLCPSLLESVLEEKIYEAKRQGR